MQTAKLVQKLTSMLLKGNKMILLSIFFYNLLSNRASTRAPDKSAFFFHFQPKYMLWVLKVMFKLMDKEIITVLHIKRIYKIVNFWHHSVR